MKQILGLLCFSVTFFSCYPENAKAAPSLSSAAFTAPASIPVSLTAAIDADKAVFLAELKRLLADDSEGLLILADKQHLLGASYAPSDLVPVAGGRSYTAGRDGLSLRAPAEAALERMAAAARRDGITLVASSTYRSYNYQKTVYERNVKEMGQAAADRESAKPGASQHQTGLVVDFGSITDDYARTAAGKWLVLHAADYGWSLSFPDGYEQVTGYRGECWHYRYVGAAAAAFQRKWFGNVQQYMMEYIDAWKKHSRAN